MPDSDFVRLQPGAADDTARLSARASANHDVVAEAAEALRGVDVVLDAGPVGMSLRDVIEGQVFPLVDGVVSLMDGLATMAAQANASVSNLDTVAKAQPRLFENF